MKHACVFFIQHTALLNPAHMADMHTNPVIAFLLIFCAFMQTMMWTIWFFVEPLTWWSNLMFTIPLGLFLFLYTFLASMHLRRETNTTSETLYARDMWAWSVFLVFAVCIMIFSWTAFQFPVQYMWLGCCIILALMCCINMYFLAMFDRCGKQGTDMNAWDVQHEDSVDLHVIIADEAEDNSAILEQHRENENATASPEELEAMICTNELPCPAVYDNVWDQ